MSKIDVSQWGEFHLYDLFTIDTGSKLDRKDVNLFPGFDYNYIGRTGDNNGIIGTCNLVDNKKKPPYPAGAFTVSLGGTVGATFVQQKPFYTSQNVDVLQPLQTMSDGIKWFIASCIYREAVLNYSAFVKELNKHIKTDFIIKLPITSDCKPDWEYMDNYISELAVRAHKDVSSLNQINPKLHKINIDNWKNFKVGDLFDVRPSKYVRKNGKAMTNAELFDNGGNPVIVNSSSNNGIGGYTTQPVTERDGVITYSDTTDGPDTMFYQAKPFVGYSHVKVMEPRDGVHSNFESMLYLTAVIKKALQQKDYTFTNKLTTPLMKNTIIQLPVDDDGQPNWQYMDSYIANCAALRHREVTALRVDDVPVFVGNWHKFKIGDVFDIQKGRRLTKADQLPGLTPFVGASADNHGITAYIGQKPIFNANTITVSYNGSVGQVFYQVEPYWASDDINVLSLKDEYDDLTGSTALFFCACIQRAGRSFGYTDKWTVNKMKGTSILLPVTPSGQPDFDYMTKYIEMIQYSAKCRLQSYHNVDRVDK